MPPPAPATGTVTAAAAAAIASEWPRGFGCHRAREGPGRPCSGRTDGLASGPWSYRSLPTVRSRQKTSVAGAGGCLHRWCCRRRFRFRRRGASALSAFHHATIQTSSQRGVWTGPLCDRNYKSARGPFSSGTADGICPANAGVRGIASPTRAFAGIATPNAEATQASAGGGRAGRQKLKTSPVARVTMSMINLLTIVVCNN